MKYKYVKFSKGTAKSNPQMIINEYDRLISNYLAETKNLSSLKTTVSVMMDSHKIEDIKSLDTCYSAYNNFDLEFNYEELKSIMESIELKFNKEFNLKQELDLIISEKNYFNNKFNNE